jgi:hypothetical protein
LGVQALLLARISLGDDMPIQPTEHELLQHLGEDQLFNLARNPSAQWAYRVAAVEILRLNKYAKAKHLEIYHILAEVEEEIVEVEQEAPVYAGPLKASVTTATLGGKEVVQKMDEEVNE